MTRVPPVTPERSPPASRITGADSPVIADSSTDAIPWITSPSLGITCPAVMTTRSPGLRSVDRTSSTTSPALRRYAGVSLRVLRSESAWALPRASASAVAKFANSTVSQSQKSSAMKYVIGTWLAEVLTRACMMKSSVSADFHHKHDRVAPLNIGAKHHDRLFQSVAHQLRFEKLLAFDPPGRTWMFRFLNDPYRCCGSAHFSILRNNG